jgi:16S rRNA (uracil1498-N3)-methyltransferase
MHIFFSQNIKDNLCILDRLESHHCIKVLRLESGDEVCIVDGKGGYFEGNIAIGDHKACVINIHRTKLEFGKRNYRLHIAIAPTKNIERFEWFLEKATEIGIDEITPVICQRSERRIIREDRLEKVITTAMKQSIKAYHPLFHPITSVDKFMEIQVSGNKLIAHCLDGVRHDLIKTDPSGNNFTILIGPEGDFSEKEVELAIEKGFLPVSLGSSRLRTETAGVASCQIIADLVAFKQEKNPEEY